MTGIYLRHVSDSRKMRMAFMNSICFWIRNDWRRGALRQILANAQLDIEQFKRPSDLGDFGDSELSVEWLDGFFERQRAREGSSPEFVDRMVNALGSDLAPAAECV